MYKVLVCDDEKDIVSAISIYLTSDGYEVIPARNGLEALDIVKHNDVHLVLMDIMMPVMDGIEAMVDLMETEESALFFAGQRQIWQKEWKIQARLQ